MDRNKNLGIASLLEKSKRNMTLSCQLRRDGEYDAAANRFYYSLFQAVKAYAVKTGKATVDEHAGVHGKMKSIVRECGRKEAKVFGDAMDLRVKADYSPASVVEADFDQTFVFNAESLLQRFINMTAGKESA